MENIINEYYEKFNFPSEKKLYDILKKNGHAIPLSKIKEVLNKKNEQQILKRPNTKSTGHIVAFYVNEFWNIDIFDMTQFENSNKGYKYIFCAIDIFSRKVWCVKMKNKNETSCLEALTEIIADNMIAPTSIISDSDKSFSAKKFSALVDKLHINYNTVPVGDHHSLGVIDRFTLTLKRIISKLRIRTGKNNWVDYLPHIIDTYNDSPHEGLEGITPNEATKDKYKEQVLKLNIEKNKSNKPKIDLFNGDKVRILKTGIFDKKSSGYWSTEIYTVENMRGKQ
jgi:hypothetical protein